MRTMLLTIILCGMAYGFPASWVTQTPVQSTGMPPIRIAGINLTTLCYQYWNWQNGSLLYTNLVAWYDMYTNSGTGYNAGTNEVDFSVSNSPATVFVGTSSGATWVASSGPTSSYYSFDGGDWTKLGNTTINTGSPFTVSFWYYYIKSANSYPCPLSLACIHTEGFKVTISEVAGYLGIGWGLQSTGVRVKSNIMPISNQWQLLTITYNGVLTSQETNWNTYVNGSLKIMIAAGAYGAAGAGRSQMGTDQSFVYWYTGFIDDVRIYNIELSAQQVTNIFEATKASHPNNWP